MLTAKSVCKSPCEVIQVCNRMKIIFWYSPFYQINPIVHPICGDNISHNMFHYQNILPQCLARNQIMEQFLHSSKNPLRGRLVKGGRYWVKDGEEAPAKDNLQISLSEILECQENGSEGKELTWSHQGTKQMMKATKMVEKVTVRLFSLCFVWPTTL